jgi:lipopolysaccharide export system protein LptC
MGDAFDTAGHDAASNQEASFARGAKQLAMVRRRSRWMKRLKFLLPASIIGLGVINASWITIQSVINALAAPNANTDEIRMTNPRFQGQTDDGERYTISGLEAIRKGLNSKTALLKSPAVDLKGKAEHPMHLQADDGVSDEDKNMFFLKGHVLIKGGSSDFSFKTEYAVIDLNKSIIFGDKHVEATGSLGHIVGEAFMISENGNRVEFNGRGEVKVNAELEP